VFTKYKTTFKYQLSVKLKIKNKNILMLLGRAGVMSYFARKRHL